MYSTFINFPAASTTEITANASGIFSDFSGFIFLILGVVLGIVVIEYFFAMIPRRWNNSESYASGLSPEADRFMAGRRRRARKERALTAYETEVETFLKERKDDTARGRFLDE
jgi:hypothetical protein